MQKLVTKEITERLIKNFNLNNPDHPDQRPEIDFEPVVKMFNPYAAGTWLFTELDPEDGDTLFGLCDLGFGFPELGYASLNEMQTCRNQFGWQAIERDIHFEADFPLSMYTSQARQKGSISA